jgi:CMP/dCMP kinase
MSRSRPSVAIDGPAGAGKTTVTRRVAERLGYVLVSTGALYRGVALAARRRGVNWNAAEELGRLASELSARGAIRFEPSPRGPLLMLDGQDVSDEISSEEIGQGASKVSVVPAVRAALLDVQRAAGAAGGVVLEGRDIGTVVLPDAEAKFFLTASVEVRAKRRFDELRARGDDAELAAIRQDVAERDRRDTTRPVAPLRRAPDALLIDSSSLSVDDVVERIVERVREVERRMRGETS